MTEELTISIKVDTSELDDAIKKVEKLKRLRYSEKETARKKPELLLDEVKPLLPKILSEYGDNKIYKNNRNCVVIDVYMRCLDDEEIKDFKNLIEENYRFHVKYDVEEEKLFLYIYRR